MAGLPGTGKSAVARGLAAALPAVILDKDAVRSALFGPDHVEYATRQDDFCVNVLLDAAGYLLGHGTARAVILDGRPFSRRYQVERVEAATERLGMPLRIVECVCSDVTARRRLAADLHGDAHPARNRDPELHRAIKAHFEPIREPKLTLDTDRDLAACVDDALAYLSPPERPPEARLASLVVNR